LAEGFGVGAIAVGGPQSRDACRPFHEIGRFNRIGTLVWSHGDDYIYRVPLRNESLAHAVLRQDLVKAPPANGLDTSEIVRYVRAIDDRSFPEVTFRWTSQHSAELTGNLKTSELVATQVNYFPGWRAYVGGLSRKTSKDGLGYIVIKPQCDGNCTIELVFDGDLEHRIVTWASLLAFFAAAYCGSLERR
jgi:hypothetical protein